MTVLTERFVQAANTILRGDASIAAANELEGVILESYPSEPELDELAEGLALYSPGSGSPYVDVPELRSLICDVLEKYALDRGTT